jgi:predicted glycogen debranching enzyme
MTTPQCHMADVARRFTWQEPSNDDLDEMIAREWIVTNGLGGYSSGTIAGLVTRRYHGLLVASLPAPYGRMVMVNQMSEQLRLADGTVLRFGAEELAGAQPQLHGARHLSEFRLELGLPVWRYHVGDVVFERRIVMPYLQNTVCIAYRMLEGEGNARLKLRPAVHFRSYEGAVGSALGGPYKLTALGERYELISSDDLPPLRMHLHARRSAFTLEPGSLPDIRYRVEESRGYEALGALWTPGYFRGDFSLENDVALMVSTEPWDQVDALTQRDVLDADVERRRRLISIAPESAHSAPAAELVLAADQFIVVPAARREEVTRARAAGEEARTVIAGYHWFTDWGRDTMISLEGLTLRTGRLREGAYILRTFLHHVRDGLIPNMFPDGANQGVYHTADATLWLFHALARYTTLSGDTTVVRDALPTLHDIVQHHLVGTRFGIHVDPADSLLSQGAEGYQLTWMDAKVDGWVVTPRRGKAVEINALWYNALCWLERWSRDAGMSDEAGILAGHASRARASFNRRFWHDKGGYLYDVVDGEHGDDRACRPNQIFAISLDHPVLDEVRWRAVYDVVSARLLTPVGLRSLDREHADYKPNYHGDLRTRDAAYHQGTVWGWLIGPFVDVHMKLFPDDRVRARALLDGFAAHLDHFGVGTIAEVFDAEPPYTPRGCISQAWSVAEVLRCLEATAD